MSYSKIVFAKAERAKVAAWEAQLSAHFVRASREFLLEIPHPNGISEINPKTSAYTLVSDAWMGALREMISSEKSDEEEVEEVKDDVILHDEEDDEKEAEDEVILYDEEEEEVSDAVDEDEDEDEEVVDLVPWRDIAPTHNKRKTRRRVMYDPSFSKQRKGSGAVSRRGFDETDMNY